MSAGPKVAKLDTARELQLRGELYARNPRPIRSYQTIAAEIEAGAAALAATTRAWQTFAPKPAALDEVERAACGLQRLVGELRAHLQGGAPNGDAA